MACTSEWLRVVNRPSRFLAVSFRSGVFRKGGSALSIVAQGRVVASALVKSIATTVFLVRPYRTIEPQFLTRKPQSSRVC
jgi:hypothetical protein